MKEKLIKLTRMSLRYAGLSDQAFVVKETIVIICMLKEFVRNF